MNDSLNPEIKIQAGEQFQIECKNLDSQIPPFTLGQVFKVNEKDSFVISGIKKDSIQLGPLFLGSTNFTSPCNTNHSAPQKYSIEVLAATKLPEKPHGFLAPEIFSFSIYLWIAIMVALFSLTGISLFIYSHMRKKKNRNALLKKSKEIKIISAEDQLKITLAMARNAGFLKAEATFDSQRLVYAELSQNLRHVIDQYLGAHSHAALTINEYLGEIKIKLAQKTISNQKIQEIESFLTTADHVRFAGLQVSPEHRELHLNQVDKFQTLMRKISS